MKHKIDPLPFSNHDDRLDSLKHNMYHTLYGGGGATARMSAGGSDLATTNSQANGEPKEVDGWVFEWECSGCNSDLSIGVTNNQGTDPPPGIYCCPICGDGEITTKIKKRTLYTEELTSVWREIKAGKTIPAIKELRKYRTKFGGDSSLKACKEDVERMTNEYNDIKGRKD